MPLLPCLWMSSSGIQIDVFLPQKWLSAVLKTHPHTVNGFCKSKFFLRIPYSLQQTSPHLILSHQETMHQIILFLVIWHTFDKHRAKPIFLLFWSHPVRDEVSGGSAICSSKLRSWFLTGQYYSGVQIHNYGKHVFYSNTSCKASAAFLQHGVHPQGSLTWLPTAFFNVVLLDVVWV